MKRSLALLALLAGIALPPAHGQGVGKSVTTPTHGVADRAKGAELRGEVNALVAVIQAGRLDEAERIAVDLQHKFEAQFEPGVRQYSFMSKEEYLDFKGTSTEAFEWIDWGYEESLHIQAFIAAERKDFRSALALHTRIEAIAPASAGAASEHGYALNQVGNPAEALVAYQRALALATRYASQRPNMAIALRGMGYSLVELQRLDEAENAYREALKIEPDNELARGEIAYIQGLRAKQQQ
jgi:tetratricopeptide (TPR) repeat protein